MALLEVRNVKKVYTAKLGAVKVQALSDVNFSVEEGEYVAIMGESGSGKTTLLNILASLDKATSGQVLLRGKDLSEIRHRDICAFRREHLGFVFQDFNLLDTLTLKDNIYLPLVLAGRDYLCCMYGGESREPKKVREAICQEAQRMAAEGIDPDAFRRCKKATYGRYIGMFSRVESVASLMMGSYFAGLENMYELLDWVRNLTLPELEQRLREDLDPRYSALSVVNPA